MSEETPGTQAALLRAQIRSCQNCRLHKQRKLAVPGEVGPDYRAGGIALLGEAPGAQEDATGRPFVGNAGRLLDSMLGEAGISRGEILLLNKVRCRPAKNAIAKYPDAVEACDQWLRQELRVYNPAVVVCLGGTAITTVFGNVGQEGRPSVTLADGMVRVTPKEPISPYGARLWIATFHPAAALRRKEIIPRIVKQLGRAKDMQAAVSPTFRALYEQAEQAEEDYQSEDR